MLRFRAAVARMLKNILFAFAISLLLACASTTPKARSVLAGNRVRSIMILPLNTTAIMSPELEHLRAPVWSELETYLRSEGKQLRTASRKDARSLWLGSIKQARSGEKGAKAGFDDAARILVFELAKYTEFDTLILPALFIREAPVSGNVAVWDGVQRELEFEQNGSEARHLPAYSSYVGVAPAASLHAVVFDAEGNKLQDSVGGLELLVRVRAMKHATPENRGPLLEFAPHTGPYANPGNVREGIAGALAPLFLPPLPSSQPKAGAKAARPAVD
jgi:hypothetical protein